MDQFGWALLDHLELENGMDFPGGCTPWMMEFVVAHELYLWPNRFRVVVEIAHIR
jgi:hypothetical protein